MSDDLRVLLIAELADPETVSVPLEGWCHSRAISALPGVEALTASQIRYAEKFERAGLETADYVLIDSERVAAPLSKLEGVLRGGGGKGWTTVMALRQLAYRYYEHELWRRLGPRIKSGEFDVVHRLTPLSPTLPSSIAPKCKRAGVPFVWGPINGGVPWPAGFDSARRREREWLSYVRGAHRLLPGYASTRRNASAIITGSRDTLAQVPDRYRDKCVYIPENAIDPERFPRRPIAQRAPGPVRAAFVGRLVPYKGLPMLIEAAAPLLKDGRLVLDVIGDGPQRPEIERMLDEHALREAVTMAGWVAHKDLHARLSRADIFTFPSVREFGGAVVLEAMALGVVPVVLDYGGPGELVTQATGFALPMGSRADVVSRLRACLVKIAGDPAFLAEMGPRAQDRAYRRFTWQAKAEQVREVYRWVTGSTQHKPDFGMPLPDEPLPASALGEAV